MEDRKIRVAITHGDTNGIGYELIFKTFAEPAMLELCTPIVYGSPKVAAYHRNVLGEQASFTIISKAEDAREGRLNLLPTFEEEVKVEIGEATAEAGTATLKALERAAEDYAKGLFDVLVTAPANRQSMSLTQQAPASQTAYLEQLAGVQGRSLTVYANELLRVAVVADQLPVKAVAPKITKELIREKAALLHQALKRHFRISNPRVAVLSLNPEACAGTEEQEAIAPAIAELEAAGVQAFGPFVADDFFGQGLFEQFDGVLAMYHDQGMTVFKTLDDGCGVRLTVGLPMLRTAAAHGILSSMAGKGTADESAFRHAVYLAIDAFRNQQNFDEPLKNPLKKLYHEKREDGEKVRFAVPKSKNENKAAE